MKLKKIVAAVCAAAMTASAVALTPLFASAETEALKTWQKDEAGSAESDTYKVSLEYGEAYDCKSVDIYLNDITTNYIKMVVVKDAGYSGESGWVSDYVNEYFEVPISGDTATLSIVLGETPNASGTANALAFTEEDTGKSDLLIAPNWLNAGSFSLSKIVIKNAEGVAFKTIVGDEITADKPETPDEGETPVVKTWIKTGDVYEYKHDSTASNGSNLEGLSYSGNLSEINQVKMDIETDGYAKVVMGGNFDTWTVSNEFEVDNTKTTIVWNVDGKLQSDVQLQIWWSNADVSIKVSNVQFVGSENADTETPVTPETPETPAAPAANPLAGNCTVMPFGGAINLAASDNAAAIVKLKDGATYEYELSEMHPVIKRRVFRSIMGKDVTIKVTYRGMTWEYNGKEITEPHTINFRTLYEKAMAETETE